jgi:O-methyltransferase
MTLPPLSPAVPGQVINYIYPALWVAQDLPEVVRLAQEIIARVPGGVHLADSFLAWGRNNSMLEDAAFLQAWAGNNETDSDRTAIWRRYILATTGYHAVQLDGDFVECGCYRAVGLKTVVDYLGGPAFPRGAWGYDLFEHEKGMAHHAMPAHGPDLVETVRAKFAGYNTVRIVQGEIPASFAQAVPDRIAWLHLDLNQPAAELAALDALFDRIVPGGMLILDDYEWAMAYRGQKLAEDPWFEARKYRVIPLPTGQGLVIKR